MVCISVFMFEELIFASLRQKIGRENEASQVLHSF
jgi:hypothetical protein